ncbi:MAG TPA: hypothetical protein VJK71_01700 [Gemmatimonadales bacterium]|nr:hypothetical protein [Gemmatimonadales bacterium]
MRRPRTFLNTILGVVVAAGCTSQSTGPTGPGMEAALVSLGEVTILTCTPLPAASASAVIGKEGGILTVGPHTLVIPAKALPKDVLITAELPSEANNSIVFGPEGLQFKQPASLTMSFDNCGAWGQLRALQIAYTDDLLKVKELVPSVADNRDKTITGSLRHFSRYAVAY